jgi:hypothetical protein
MHPRCRVMDLCSKFATEIESLHAMMFSNRKNRCLVANTVNMMSADSLQRVFKEFHCVLKGYVQVAGGPNRYPLCGPLYDLGLDACLYRGKLNWN